MCVHTASKCIYPIATTIKYSLENVQCVYDLVECAYNIFRTIDIKSLNDIYSNQDLAYICVPTRNICLHKYKFLLNLCEISNLNLFRSEKPVHLYVGNHI